MPRYYATQFRPGVFAIHDSERSGERIAIMTQSANGKLGCDWHDKAYWHASVSEWIKACEAITEG